MLNFSDYRTIVKSKLQKRIHHCEEIKSILASASSGLAGIYASSSTENLFNLANEWAESYVVWRGLAATTLIKRPIAAHMDAWVIWNQLLQDSSPQEEVTRMLCNLTRLDCCICFPISLLQFPYCSPSLIGSVEFRTFDSSIGSLVFSTR